jgi:hypothetical protein
MTVDFGIEELRNSGIQELKDFKSLNPEPLNPEPSGFETLKKQN